MAQWPPITRDDLRHAAGLAGFDADFPLLVRRLIAETGCGVTELDMPGGSGVSTGGFDGVVTTSESALFVPAGMSVWELSVEKDAQGKANADYGKRLTGPGGEATCDISYMQVSLAHWGKAKSWAAERNREGRWKKVYAYNLDSVHTWLDTAPATMAWLAERLGKAWPGVQAVDTWWADWWLSSTTVPLDADIVLAGRHSAAKTFDELARSGQATITVGGDLHADELRAFVAAHFEHANNENSTAVAARTLFVDSRESLAQLLRHPTRLVLVVADAALLTGLPLQHGHQVIVPVEPGEDADVVVPRLDDDEVANRLRAAGIEHEHAYRYGILARRSLSALRRALAVKPAVLRPQWARAPGRTERRLVLIGGWDGTNVHDRHLVQKLVGCSYDDVQEAAHLLAASGEMPLLGNLREHWHVLSRGDAWSLLEHHFHRDDLEALREACLEVFGEPIPPGHSGGYSRRHRYSTLLREGLADSLALLGTTKDLPQLPSGMTGGGTAEAIVEALVTAANADDTYGLWISLTDVLPELAEAAPDPVLRGMRAGLRGPAPLHRRMFLDNDTNVLGPSGWSPHLDVLRALHVLAWSPDHLDEVADILAALDDLDPGGSWSNRPAASLVELFHPARPSTSADWRHRLRVLRRLLHRHPEAGRRLLNALLPGGRPSRSLHGGPKHRAWARRTPLNNTDLNSTLSGIMDLLIDDLADDPAPYRLITDKIDRLTPENRHRLTERFIQLGSTLDDEAARADLSHTLRTRAARHREYPDAKWALPEDQLQVIDQAAAAMQPRTAVMRAASLFTITWLHLGIPHKRDDPVAHEQAMQRVRTEALTAVITEGGLTAVAELAAMTQYPHLVGAALADHTTDLDATMLDWLDSPQPQREVAMTYLRMRLSREGTSLRDNLLTAAATPAIQASILEAGGDSAEATRTLQKLPSEVSEHYWSSLSCYDVARTDSHTLEAARGFLSAGRHEAAITLIAMRVKNTDTAEAAELAATAMEALLTATTPEPRSPRPDEYHYQALFALLASHATTVGRQRVMRLEWLLLPKLGHEPDAPTIHAALADDPALFAEVVGHRYQPLDDDTDDPIAEDEPRRFIKVRAYEILDSWSHCPGLGPDGFVDAERLRDWVLQVRAQLDNLGLTEQGDREIGCILARAPADHDGLFPPRAVRAVLEDLDSDHADDTFHSGVIARQGVTVRGMTDGGVLERDLAAAYRRQANDCDDGPRTRRLLRNIAQTYEHLARSEDDEAERLRRGLPD
ncbi:hypothetical protein AB0A74_05155 [Saccharothrix sp. NPDC042600]|uniref:hypothetical protein n=1 Tax=Saccharothrix TaxID=2071 RepID=UPI0033FA636A|nr:hypothetical protein GCM10017745_36820 [Saccharothrix mutabilis subsp. capreolus]